MSLPDSTQERLQQAQLSAENPPENCLWIEVKETVEIENDTLPEISVAPDQPDPIARRDESPQTAIVFRGLRQQMSNSWTGNEADPVARLAGAEANIRVFTHQ